MGPLAAAGATTPPRGPSAVARAAGNDLSVARLSGLRNYSFSYVVGSPSQEAAVGRVHGTTDWQLTVTVGARTPSVTTYDVGGHGYSQVKGFASIEPVTFATPEGFTHLNGEHTWAQALVDALHVTGVRVTTAGTCRVAGQRGTLYVLKTPTASEGVFSLTDRACVERSGPLLSFAEGVTGGSAAGAIGLTGRSETFTVTSIGRIGVVRAPKGSASAPPSTSAPATSPTVSGRLPAGFPSTVPAPPGTLVSATRLGATKWYVLLTEPSAHALATYVAGLEARGFTVLTRSTTAASTVVDLGDASYRVVLEQMSLPGEGVTLTVTVGRA
ncbi:MAG TPA: hypothetical protein PLS29_03940 [Acidimicrobiales bacterium]|nr:hypothetical protein [Acidimicrobiales bacterium]